MFKRPKSLCHYIQALNDETYQGVYFLSQQVADEIDSAIDADIQLSTLFSEDPSGRGYLSALEVLRASQNAWNNNNQQDQFPGVVITALTSSLARQIAELSNSPLNENSGFTTSETNLINLSNFVEVLEGIDPNEADDISLSIFDSLFTVGNIATLVAVLGPEIFGKLESDYRDSSGEFRDGFSEVSTSDGRLISIVDSNGRVTAVFDGEDELPAGVLNILNGIIGGVNSNEDRTLEALQGVIDVVDFPILVPLLERLAGTIDSLTGVLSTFRRGLTESNTITFNGDNRPNQVNPLFSSTPDVLVQNENLGSEGADQLVGSTNPDTINSLGADDVVFGGGGSDMIDGGAGDDVIYGQEGRDILSGGSGNDIVRGGSGNDDIFGGADNDILDGGGIAEGPSGIDTIAGEGGNDWIVGGDGNDTLYGGEALANATAPSGNDHIFGGDGVDYLYGGDGTDDLFGGAGNDELFGEGGKDTLVGGSDNDTLTGGQGLDILRGGAGSDTYQIFTGDSHDVIIDEVEDGDLGPNGQSTIRINGSVASDFQESHEGSGRFVDSAGNVAYVEGTQLTLLVGGDLENGSLTIPNYDPSTDSFGLSFTDAVEPEQPTGEQFIVGDGSEPEEAIAEQFNSLRTSTQFFFFDRTSFRLGPPLELNVNAFPLVYDASIYEIDNITNTFDDDGSPLRSFNGGLAGDTLIGDDGSDILGGFDGNDYISGGGRPDLIFGNAGSDFILGGDGGDVIHSGTPFDIADADLFRNSVLGDFTFEAVFQFENPDDLDIVLGGEGNDALYGSNYNDVLDGGVGSDFIYGGAGNDTLIAGDDDSQNTVFGDSTGYFLDDEVFGLTEILIFAPVDGFTYNDQITGGEGTDELAGELGDDFISGGAGDDVIEGDRTIVGADTPAERPAIALPTQFHGDDVLFGGSGMDTVLGNFGNDIIYGGEGDDTLLGDNDGDLNILGGGDDQIFGESGMDTLAGGSGTDFLDGGEDDDELRAGPGDDTLIGGTGNDELIGGGGQDTYVFELGDGVDDIDDTLGRNTIILSLIHI